MSILNKTNSKENHKYSVYFETVFIPFMARIQMNQFYTESGWQGIRSDIPPLFTKWMIEQGHLVFAVERLDMRFYKLSDSIIERIKYIEAKDFVERYPAKRASLEVELDSPKETKKVAAMSRMYILLTTYTESLSIIERFENEHSK